MFEEPFRWMEAISTRHSYVREKLKKARPVLGVPYDEGAVIFGFAPQSGKIFEIYDRIALGGLGHPADIERLRMTLLDMAHIEGFSRSAQDVTIARLLQFGIAPTLKQNFEEIQRAPYLVQLLLAELDNKGVAGFYRLSYDGYWETFKKGAVIVGDWKVQAYIQKKIGETDFTSLKLDQALKKGLHLWEEGCRLGDSEKYKEDGENDKEETGDAPSTLKDVFEQWTLEVAVLNKNTGRKRLYRALGVDEIDALKEMALK